MKNIIPFKKDVIFKTKLGEITSISLENTLNLIDDVIEGNFIISGEYKENLESKDNKPFSLELPFKSVIDERYITDNAVIDIDDFYYEITSDNILSISIDVLIDRLEEKPLIRLNNMFEVKKEELTEEESIKEIESNEKEETEESNKIKEKITTIFNTDNSEDTYVTYNVCIIRDGDTIESIIDKYKIDRETLEKYNNLSDIKKGDKLIIPSES